MSRENWWLDYIEGEVDPATRVQMKALLKSSASDQDLVKSLSDTKGAVKESVREPSISEDQLDFLHDKIMSSIEETEIKPAAYRLRMSPEHRRFLRNTAMALAFLFSMGSGVLYISHKGPNTQWDVPHQIAYHAQENPDELAQLISYQSETDFFVDVASLSLDYLTKEQFESLFKPTKTR